MGFAFGIIALLGFVGTMAVMLWYLVEAVRVLREDEDGDEIGWRRVDAFERKA